MNTTQPSSPPMPFGCKLARILNYRFMLIWKLDSFQEFSDVPAPPAPGPAPGPALLDDNDTGILDEFFNNIDAGQAENNNYFLQEPADNKPVGSWDWSVELPPTYHGSTTSFAPPLAHSLVSTGGDHDNLYDISHGAAYNPVQSQATTTSPEVLAAASTLFQNGLVTQYQSASNDYSPKTSSRNNHPHIPYRRDGAFVTNNTGRYARLAVNPGGLYGQEPLSQGGNLVGDHATTFCDMSHNNNENHNTHQMKTFKSADLHWGSDQSFLHHGFVAPPNQETVEDVTKTMLTKMECLEPQTSAANTRPSSPTTERRKRPTNKEDEGSGLSRQNGLGLRDVGSTTQGSIESRPKKRRKGKVKLEAELEEDDGQLLEATQRPKKLPRTSSSRTSKVKQRVLSEEPQTKRARSLSGEQKSGRENLTEEQKRSNHILSEQKRRNLIRQGFEDLCELVPDLKGGGFSKSAMLTQAADWLDELIHGNKRLRAQLESLGEESLL